MNPLLMLLGTGLLLATLFALGKQAALQGLAPGLVLFWQVAGAALALGLAALWLPRLRPPVDSVHLRYYLLSGLLGVSVPNLMLYISLRHLDLGMVALITALSTLITYLGALLLRMERWRLSRAAGCVLGFVGVSMLGSGRLTGAADPRWLLAALAVPTSLALGNLYRSRAWPGATPPMALATGMVWSQLPVVWLIASLLNPGTALLGADYFIPPTLLAVAALAPVVYAASFALQKIGGPVYISQLGYVLSIGSLALGMLLFEERHGPQVGLAAALVLGGLLLANRRSGASCRSTPAPRLSTETGRRAL